MPSVDCNSDEYRKYLVLVILLIIVYVIGLPLTITVILWKRRVQVKKAIRHAQRENHTNASGTALAHGDTIAPMQTPPHTDNNSRIHKNNKLAQANSASEQLHMHMQIPAPMPLQLSSSGAASSTSSGESNGSTNNNGASNGAVNDEEEAASLRRFYSSLQILFAPYQESFYFWHVVILLRRSIVSAIFTFTYYAPGIRQTVILFFHGFALGLSMKIRPFYKFVANSLEVASLGMLMCISAILADDPVPPYTVLEQALLSLFIVIPCCIFIFAIVANVIFNNMRRRIEAARVGAQCKSKATSGEDANEIRFETSAVHENAVKAGEDDELKPHQSPPPPLTPFTLNLNAPHTHKETQSHEQEQSPTLHDRQHVGALLTHSARRRPSDVTVEQHDADKQNDATLTAHVHSTEADSVTVSTAASAAAYPTASLPTSKPSCRGKADNARSRRKQQTPTQKPHNGAGGLRQQLFILFQRAEDSSKSLSSATVTVNHFASNAAAAEEPNCEPEPEPVSAVISANHSPRNSFNPPINVMPLSLALPVPSYQKHSNSVTVTQSTPAQTKPSAPLFLVPLAVGSYSGRSVSSVAVSVPSPVQQTVPSVRMVELTELKFNANPLSLKATNTNATSHKQMPRQPDDEVECDNSELVSATQTAVAGLHQQLQPHSPVQAQMPAPVQAAGEANHAVFGSSASNDGSMAVAESANVHPGTIDHQPLPGAFSSSSAFSSSPPSSQPHTPKQHEYH